MAPDASPEPKDPSPVLPQDAAPDGYVAVARVRRPFGLKGELKCQLLTDFPDRFKRGLRLRAGDRDLVVRSSRLHKGDLLLHVHGIDTPEQAEDLRGALLCVAEGETVPLPEDTYFVHDLLGLAVVTGRGETLGRLEEVLPTGANDVWIVRGERGEYLLPAVEDVVREVDLAGGRVVVELLEGMEPAPPKHEQARETRSAPVRAKRARRPRTRRERSPGAE